MKIVRCFLAIIMTAACARAQGDASLSGAVQALPAQIETVASGGYWSRNGQDGSFRLVIASVGSDELSSRVFLQWVRLDPDKREQIVERTIPIKEIAGRWRVVSQRFVLRGKHWDIVVSAERRVPPAKATFTITPSAEFSYTLVSSEK